MTYPPIPDDAVSPATRIDRRHLIGGAAAGLALMTNPLVGIRSLHAQEQRPVAVVSSHRLATEAGVEVLEAGGTASEHMTAVVDPAARATSSSNASWNSSVCM